MRLNEKAIITLICCVIISVGFFSGCMEKRSDIAESKIEEAGYKIDIYNLNKVYNGTTMFGDGSDSSSPKIVEVDMNGNIIWEYKISPNLIKGKLVGFDTELLSNNNVLMVLSQSGVYEVDRDGNIVWSYLDPKVSHDADRLLNGNTLVAFGNNDTKDDAQVKEINHAGEIVWEWHAKDVYGNDMRYKDIQMQGWTHANAVQRLKNGNTMINLRNFYLTVIVDKNGSVIREYDWSKFGNDTDPHEPEIHEDDNTLLICLQNDSPYVAVEINMETEEALWTYTNHNIRTARDANKLPNGNVLIVAVDNGGTNNNVDMQDDFSTIFEVTSNGETVWRLDLKNISVGKGPGWFYKAERINS